MRYALIAVLLCGLLLGSCASKPFDYFGQDRSFTPSPYQEKVAQFGGFEGDCASDANFPYYFQCQSERAGDADSGDGDGGDGGDGDGD